MTEESSSNFILPFSSMMCSENPFVVVTLSSCIFISLSSSFFASSTFFGTTFTGTFFPFILTSVFLIPAVVFAGPVFPFTAGFVLEINLFAVSLTVFSLAFGTVAEVGLLIGGGIAGLAAVVVVVVGALGFGCVVVVGLVDAVLLIAVVAALTGGTAVFETGALAGRVVVVLVAANGFLDTSSIFFARGLMSPFVSGFFSVDTKGLVLGLAAKVDLTAGLEGDLTSVFNTLMVLGVVGVVGLLVGVVGLLDGFIDKVDVLFTGNCLGTCLGALAAGFVAAAAAGLEVAVVAGLAAEGFSVDVAVAGFLAAARVEAGLGAAGFDAAVVVAGFVVRAAGFVVVFVGAGFAAGDLAGTDFTGALAVVSSFLVVVMAGFLAETVLVFLASFSATIVAVPAATAPEIRIP